MHFWDMTARSLLNNHCFRATFFSTSLLAFKHTFYYVNQSLRTHVALRNTSTPVHKLLHFSNEPQALTERADRLRLQVHYVRIVTPQHSIVGTAPGRVAI